MKKLTKQQLRGIKSLAKLSSDDPSTQKINEQKISEIILGIKYSLVNVDGNAFSIISYTRSALKSSGNKELLDKYQAEAMSKDYKNLVAVSNKYLEIANG